MVTSAGVQMTLLETVLMLQVALMNRHSDDVVV